MSDDENGDPVDRALRCLTCSELFTTEWEDNHCPLQSRVCRHTSCYSCVLHENERVGNAVNIECPMCHTERAHRIDGLLLNEALVAVINALRAAGGNDIG